jgi:hypothetical protein
MLYSKYGLAHKPTVAGLCWFMLWPPGISDKKFLAYSVNAWQTHTKAVCSFLVIEQQANDSFCFKHMKTTKESQPMLETVEGNEVLKRTRVFVWF